MQMLYFLITVAACAAGLIWFVVKTTRSGKSFGRERGQRSSRPLHYPEHHPHLNKLAFHGHAHHLQPSSRDVWSAPKRREVEEVRGSYSLTAHKIDFDAEVEASRESEDLAMPEIEYIPTEPAATAIPRASGSSQRGRRQ